MDIKSIKQSLTVTTAQPLVELIKLISAKNVKRRLARVLSSITVTTINDFVCRYEGVHLRQVLVVSKDTTIELRFDKTDDAPLEIESLNRLTMSWVNDEGGDVSFDLQDIFNEMGSIEVNTLIVDVMKQYSKIDVSKHGISAEYSHYFDEGDEVSELNVVIDGVDYNKTARHEQFGCDDDETDCEYSYLTHETPQLLLLKFMDDLESFNLPPNI